MNNLDQIHQTQLWTAQLLERGLSESVQGSTFIIDYYRHRRVDICWNLRLDLVGYPTSVRSNLTLCRRSNWIGNLAWAEALEWTGKDEFNSQELKPWTVNGKQAGRYKSSKGFTYATVKG